MSDDWIPIILFLSIAAVAITWLLLSHRNKVALLSTIEKSINGGTPMTPEMLERISYNQSPRVKDLRRGVVLMALGLAGIMAGYLSGDVDARTPFLMISMLPLFMGAGFLVVWGMNRYRD